MAVELPRGTEALGAVINFGTSVGHIPTRAAAMTGKAVPLSIANDPCCMIEAKQFEGTDTGHRETCAPHCPVLQAAVASLFRHFGQARLTSPVKICSASPAQLKKLARCSAKG